jgi:hypothetical protein
VHAQAETAQLVLERGGDYLFALKANRPAMLEAVAAFFADPPGPLEVFVTTDADHGRVETRRHRVTHATGWLLGDRAEPGARADARPRHAGLRRGCARRRRALDPVLPLLRPLSPERFARAVRSHWAIENSLHWVLGVTFDEDAARNRADNGPENLAILRRLTLNLLRTARPKLPVSRKRKRSGWSDHFARSIIGQMR